MEIQGKSLPFCNFEASLKLKGDRGQTYPMCLGLGKGHGLCLSLGAERTDPMLRVFKETQVAKSQSSALLLSCVR